LEALRVLLNYETNEVKLLQLVLLGQMELLPTLQGLPNLVDRISLKCTLEPLSISETREMIQFRLQEAGYRSHMPLFSEEAIEEIYEYTEGYPRRIALLCHTALRRLVMHHGRSVDRGVIEELIQREMKTGWAPSRKLQKSTC